MDVQISWEVAEATCLNDNGHLLSIHSAFEAQEIEGVKSLETLSISFYQKFSIT